jgi:hypothetical protein
MNEYLIFVAPVIGLIGVFLGAYIQSMFARKNQEKNSLAEQRNKAYADFLNAASKIAVAQRLDKRDVVVTELANLADAKSRICVYGNSDVVQKLAVFLRHGGTLQTESEILSFTKLCYSIRESVGLKRSDLKLSDISQLLFSVDVNDTARPH